MGRPPRIARRKPSEQFQRYAERDRAAASACASLLSSTRDPVQRQHIETKLQQYRTQAAFNEEKALEARVRGD